MDARTFFQDFKELAQYEVHGRPALAACSLGLLLKRLPTRPCVRQFIASSGSCISTATRHVDNDPDFTTFLQRAVRYGCSFRNLQSVEAKVTRIGRLAGRPPAAVYTSVEILAACWESLVAAVDAVVSDLSRDRPLHDSRHYGQNETRSVKRKTMALTLANDTFPKMAAFLAAAIPSLEGSLRPLPLTACAEKVVEISACAVGIALDVELVAATLSHLCVGGFEPSDFFAYTFVRTDTFTDIVGKNLGMAIRRNAHATQLLECECPEAVDASSELLQELVETRKEMVMLKFATRNRGMDLHGNTFQVGNTLLCSKGSDVAGETLPKHFQRASINLALTEYISHCRVALKHLPQSLSEVNQISSLAKGEQCNWDSMLGMNKTTSLSSFILELDAALDLHMQQRIARVGTSR
jgi:hypothetical protein